MSALIVIAVDREYGVIPQGTWVPGEGVFTETLCPRLKAKGEQVVSSASYQPIGCAFGDQTLTSGVGAISSGAQKVTSDNLAPLLITDEGQCDGVLTGPSGSTTCSCKIVLADAGQQKASGK